jgi:hypothetical protein
MSTSFLSLSRKWEKEHLFSLHAAIFLLQFAEGECLQNRPEGRLVLPNNIRRDASQRSKEPGIKKMGLGRRLSLFVNHGWSV